MINIKKTNFLNSTLKGINLYILSGILTIGILGLLMFYSNSPKQERQEAYIDLEDPLNKGLALNEVLFVALQEKKINAYLPDNESEDIFGKVKVQPFVTYLCHYNDEKEITNEEITIALENGDSSVTSVANNKKITKTAIYYVAEPSDTGIHIIPKWIRPYYVQENKKIFIGSFRYEEVEVILKQQHSTELLSRIQDRNFKCYEYEIILK
jgi:hypothetical protein